MPSRVTRTSLTFAVVVAAVAVAVTAASRQPPPSLASPAMRLDCGGHLTYRVQATLGDDSAGEGGGSSPADGIRRGLRHLGVAPAVTNVHVATQTEAEAHAEFALHNLPAKARSVRSGERWVLHELVACVIDPTDAAPTGDAEGAIP